MSSFKIGLMSVLALVLSASAAQATSVKANPEAAAGCIPRVSLAVANAAIERFHLGQENATQQEIQTLGTALVWIEKLNGGQPLSLAVADAEHGYTYKFVSEEGNSQQMGQAIMIRRNGVKQNGQNVAQLVHELGHFIGNRGAYGDYHAATKGEYCVVSSYSDDKPNEQFAEAFATFVSFPALMKSIDTPACHRAYAFFKNQLFANGALADKCADGTLQAGVDY